MMIVITLITIAGCGYGIFFAYNFLNKRSAVSVGKQRDKLLADIGELSGELEDLLKYKDSYCAKGQYATVTKRLEERQKDLENEKAALKELESRLDEAQTNVEQKESHQQELKSSREEDEIKLEEILTSYSDISSESISLEQKLAQSLKNLDSISEEVELNDDQKAILEDLSSALSNAGENLRNLLMEFETVNERLTLLREQHEDLEDEYTKLVEQQLGE